MVVNIRIIVFIRFMFPILLILPFILSELPQKAKTFQKIHRFMYYIGKQEFFVDPF